MPQLDPETERQCELQRQEFARHHIQRRHAHGDTVDLAAAPAVHRVSAPGAEPGDVKVRRALPDFLVRREGDADGAVRDVGMRHEEGCRGDDFGHAGFVVRSQQRRAVRGDDRRHVLVAHVDLGEAAPAERPRVPAEDP